MITAVSKDDSEETKKLGIILVTKADLATHHLLVKSLTNLLLKDQ